MKYIYQGRPSITIGYLLICVEHDQQKNTEYDI